MIDQVRRLFVCMTVLGCWLLLGAGSVEAQCSPNPCYTDNKPTVVTLTSSQYAAQGDGHTNTAVTMNVSYVDQDGVEYAHHATIGGGTALQVNYQSYNASRVDLYYSSNGGSLIPWKSNVALSGSFPWNFSGQQTLQLFAVATSSSGATTQDVDTLTITSQAPGVYSGDRVGDGFYTQINTSGGGGSMAADFTECQGGEIHQCINATHTPYTTLTLNNTTQGTSQTNPKHQSGNIANYTSNVSFGDSITVAAGLNDILDFSEDDEVDCSVSGPIPLPNYHLRIVPYQIFDKVDSYDGKVRFQVEPWCYNCCIPARQGCPEPITLTDHVTYSPGGNPPKIPTFFYSLGFCANGNFPGMVSGQWECSPGLAIPFYGTGWIKAYCTPYETPPY